MTIFTLPLQRKQPWKQNQTTLSAASAQMLASCSPILLQQELLHRKTHPVKAFLSEVLKIKLSAKIPSLNLSRNTALSAVPSPEKAKQNVSCLTQIQDRSAFALAQNATPATCGFWLITRNRGTGPDVLLACIL